MFLFEEEDSLYDWISCVIPDRFYFGPFPNQRMMNRLIREGFTLIINLTYPTEQELYHIVPSPPGFPLRPVHTLHFPIPDHSPPESAESYCEFITTVKHHLLNRQKSIFIAGADTDEAVWFRYR